MSGWSQRKWQLLTGDLRKASKFLAANSGAFGVILALFAVLASAGGTIMSSADSRIQMQASILNDFKNDFDNLGEARCDAAGFALAHMNTLRRGTIPYKKVPSRVWQVMDFFDKLSMYSSRHYIDQQMTFVGFYYWMGPYYEFYKEEVDDFQGANRLAMYNGIEEQVDVLRRVAIDKLGKTDHDFNTALSDEKIKEFFELERDETCAPGAIPSAPAEPRATAWRIGTVTSDCPECLFRCLGSGAFS